MTHLNVRSTWCRTRLATSPAQAVLDLFKETMREELAWSELGVVLQRIKQLFVQRDYDAIFMNPAHLPVYVCEYQPSRVLCYVDLIVSSPPLLALVHQATLRICAIGGGAGSDVVALGAVRTLIASPQHDHHHGHNDAEHKDGMTMMDVLTVDMGDWGPVLDRLVDGMRAKWSLAIKSTFQRYNVLHLSEATTSPEERERLFTALAEVDLVVILFTINELFQISKARAIAFMQLLLRALRPGAHVLVVDSAGDFSHLQVGSKTFMVYTLLDAIKGWTKVVGHDSRWFRFPPDKLAYPLELNNMRYFARLYHVD